MSLLKPTPHLGVSPRDEKHWWNTEKSQLTNCTWPRNIFPVSRIQLSLYPMSKYMETQQIIDSRALLNLIIQHRQCLDEVFHNHSLNPVKSNRSPPHHRTRPQRPRLSVSFFGFTAIWEGSGRIRAALGWEISRWHRLHPLWSRQNIRHSCLRREKAEGWNRRWRVGSFLPQEETARFTLQLEAEERPPLPVNYDLLTT